MNLATAPGRGEDAVDRVSPETALAWSDLFLCLGRAWLPPPAGLSAADWCGPLADDLDDLGTELGLDVQAATAALRDEAGKSEARDPWLVVYSRLFLVPPVPVTLNTGIYLEGALGGNASQMMQACYRVAGFEQDLRFRDLPDHAAMQLEFLGALFERGARGDPDAVGQAREFLAGFVDHWAEPLRKACERAVPSHAEAKTFAELARVVESALATLA
ncbi:MAG: hypothetical protein ABS55_13045 [Lautropia sp. SCN 70-15]|nr:MAG: hypothetical protein ABS55_13045 [Lautropia sp. SCN 70-15]